jgi:hypothetical protein
MVTQRNQKQERVGRVVRVARFQTSGTPKLKTDLARVTAGLTTCPAAVTEIDQKQKKFPAPHTRCRPPKRNPAMVMGARGRPLALPKEPGMLPGPAKRMAEQQPPPFQHARTCPR